MKNNGFYIKARQIKESWIAEARPVVREVWDYLIREANHSEVKYGGFIVERGSLFRSYREIRDDLKWRVGYRYERYSESQMKRAMADLRREGMIELTSEPRGNLIKVLNYDKFQDIGNYVRTDARTDGRTSSEPVANQCRLPINKECKGMERKERKNSTFIKPELPEIISYLIEIQQTKDLTMDPENIGESFRDYHEANGWKGKSGTIKDWKAAARTWVRNGIKFGDIKQQKPKSEWGPTEWKAYVLEDKMTRNKRKIEYRETKPEMYYEATKEKSLY